MKNIHVIPTSSPSKIFYIAENFHLEKGQLIEPKSYHNVYITSDEEIKEGDWLIGGTDDESKNEVWQHDGVGYICDEDKKIILTTDADLIADGVQAIDDTFLEWFVKNPSCEWVDVEKTFVTNSGLGYQEYAVLDSNFKVIEINAKTPQTSYYLGKITILSTYEYVIHYKIIIPQEEPKQETLEEAIDRIAKEDGYDIDGGKVADFVDGMVKGAKWQAERMFNNKEVLELLLNRPGPYLTDDEIKEWFEQFKKK
jgi:hypothetical protein